ncbi:hypothetical protein [Bacillus sp. PS06]|nr:hypothetical protein [Bacillus sp. PS06]MBD8071456.1 hypothetical protein [Bacillus sp. PS06]
MKKGTKVIYNDKTFQIFHVYESGYCELKEISTYVNVILVHEKELVLS